ncbi:MAG: hypothetical protein ACUVTL_05495 [Thermoproteota archaeon]
MAWGMGFGVGFGRWIGLWPGRGPFSYLPPWQRPGWLYGRGACWWLFNPYVYGYPGYGSWSWRGAYPLFGYRMPNLGVPSWYYPPYSLP